MSDCSSNMTVVKRCLTTGMYASLGYLTFTAANETPLKFKYTVFAYNVIFICCGHGIYKMGKWVQSLASISISIANSIIQKALYETQTVFNPSSGWDVFDFVMDNCIIGLIGTDISMEAQMQFSWTITQIICTIVPFLTFMINGDIEPEIACVFFPISAASLMYISYDTGNEKVAYIALSEFIGIKLFPCVVRCLSKDCVTVEFFKVFAKHITVMLASMLLCPMQCSVTDDAII